MPPPPPPTALATDLGAHGNLDAMVGAVAQWLSDLHATTPSDPMPSERGLRSGWEALSADIEAAVDRNQTDPLPDPYARYSRSRLIEIWQQGRPSTEDSASEELVLCHGYPVLSAFTVSVTAPVEVTEVANTGTWRLADRHHDLAVIQQSVHHHLGAEAVFVFYEAYGAEPDIVRLDHHVLGSLLLHGPESKT